MPPRKPFSSASSSAKKAGDAKTIGADQLLQKLKVSAEKLTSSPQLPVSRALTESGVKTPLVFLSNQHVRVKRLVGWLRENLLSQSSSSFASYFGGDLGSAQSTEAIIADLVSLSLFAKNQMIVIYEADKMKAPAQKALVEALPRTTDTSLLILAAEGINTKATLLQEAAAAGTVVELAELGGTQLERWIDKEVQRAGIASGITAEARQLLITCYGGDISRLAPEIEKLSLLVVPGEPISRELVEAISLRSPEVTSFELVKQLAAKNALRSVSLANDLILQGLHPLQVNSFLSRAFRILLAQKDRGSNPIASELNNPWFARQLGTSASAFTAKELSAAIGRLTKLDFQLKDSGFPAPLALSLAVQQIAARK